MPELQQPTIKKIETDGPPAAGEYVLVHCGSYRCLGYFTTAEKWVDAHGNELRDVIGYYPLS